MLLKVTEFENRNIHSYPGQAQFAHVHDRFYDPTSTRGEKTGGEDDPLYSQSFQKKCSMFGC